MVLDTLVDTEDMVLDTLVDTDSATEATPVVTTASMRLRLSPRLMLMLRLIPTSDTDTLVATPALDTLVDTEDMVLDTLVDTDSVMEATPVVTTASARLRLSPRLMLMLRLIPTRIRIRPGELRRILTWIRRIWSWILSWIRRYGLGYSRGYGLGYGGYSRGYYGKREAEAEPKADADA